MVRPVNSTSSTSTTCLFSTVNPMSLTLGDKGFLMRSEIVAEKRNIKFAAIDLGSGTKASNLDLSR